MIVKGEADKASPKLLEDIMPSREEYKLDRFTNVIEMLKKKRTNINDRDVKEILIALECHGDFMDILEDEIDSLGHLIQEKNEIIEELEEQLNEVIAKLEKRLGEYNG